jgi:hypothetical protein
LLPVCAILPASACVAFARPASVVFAVLVVMVAIP